MLKTFKIPQTIDTIDNIVDKARNLLNSNELMIACTPCCGFAVVGKCGVCLDVWCECACLRASRLCSCGVGGSAYGFM